LRRAFSRIVPAKLPFGEAERNTRASERPGGRNLPEIAVRFRPPDRDDFEKHKIIPV
jgi:hypothetical protein